MIDAEEWRTIPGVPYEASSLGRIRRSGRAKGARPGRILKAYPTRTRAGIYLKTQLTVEGAAVGAWVHRLVAAAWYGPAPEAHDADHRDNDKFNNCPENLRWRPAKTNRPRKADP